jgi:GT2 family glycosyltransferase
VKPIDLSVIVVSYNTKGLLTECLRSVFAAEPLGRLEVLVVDNASSDHSAAMVDRDFPAVRLIRNDHNRGFAGANNQALQVAQAGLILLLNSDAAVLPDAFTQLQHAFAEHSTMAVAGLRLLNSDGSLQPSWGSFPNPVDEFLFQTFLYKVWPTHFPYGRQVHPWQRAAYRQFRWVDWVTGAALVFRRSVYERVGGLPEEGGMYGEDLEFCWRAKAAGFRVAYCPEARAYHRLQGSGGGDFARWIENYSRATLDYYGRHCSPEHLRRVASYIRLGSLFRQSLWRIMGRVFPKRRIEANSRINGYRRTVGMASETLRASSNGTRPSS